MALEAGFQVRAVIRKTEQAAKLQSHARVAPYAASVQWATIPDLTDAGSLDSNLTGVTGILHLASPLAIEASISHPVTCTSTNSSLDR